MPRRPPREWFYYVVGELEQNSDIKNAKAVAAWLWYKFMKPETKRAVLEAEGKLDPLKARKGLIKSPQVLRFNDLKGDGLVRVLHRKDGSYFPEFAFYPRSRTFLRESLRDAAFNEEEAGKWVLRTNKFSIFVYF